MALQRCLGYQGQRCGQLVNGSRCTEHARMVNRARMAQRRQVRPDLHLSHAERQRRAQAVADHKAQHGNLCPGWLRPPHYTEDLTADHPTAVRAGGSQDQDLDVYCRQCNGVKSHTTSPPPPGSKSK